MTTSAAGWWDGMGQNEFPRGASSIGPRKSHALLLPLPLCWHSYTFNTHTNKNTLSSSILLFSGILRNPESKTVTSPHQAFATSEADRFHLSKPLISIHHWNSLEEQLALACTRGAGSSQSVVWKGEMPTNVWTSSLTSNTKTHRCTDTLLHIGW